MHSLGRSLVGTAVTAVVEVVRGFEWMLAWGLLRSQDECCWTRSECGSTFSLGSCVVSWIYWWQQIKWGQATFYHVTGTACCMRNLHIALCLPCSTTGVNLIMVTFYHVTKTVCVMVNIFLRLPYSTTPPAIESGSHARHVCSVGPLIRLDQIILDHIKHYCHWAEGNYKANKKQLQFNQKCKTTSSIKCEVQKWEWERVCNAKCHANRMVSIAQVWKTWIKASNLG